MFMHTHTTICRKVTFCIHETYYALQKHSVFVLYEHAIFKHKSNVVVMHETTTLCSQVSLLCVETILCVFIDTYCLHVSAQHLTKYWATNKSSTSYTNIIYVYIYMSVHI